MIDFHEFERRNRDQMREMARAVQQERIAARTKAQGVPLDLRCWVMSRIEYVSDLARHWIRRVSRTRSHSQPLPVLGDCQ